LLLSFDMCLHALLDQLPLSSLFPLPSHIPYAEVLELIELDLFRMHSALARFFPLLVLFNVSEAHSLNGSFMPQLFFGLLAMINFSLDFQLQLAFFHHVTQIKFASEGFHTLCILVEERVSSLNCFLALSSLERGFFAIHHLPNLLLFINLRLTICLFLLSPGIKSVIPSLHTRLGHLLQILPHFLVL